MFFFAECVLWKWPAVCCDYCDHCVHISCDPSLSIEAYENMVSNPSTDPWSCSCCKDSLVEHVCDSSSATSTKSDVSCICLNAHSVVPKRFDLSAYLFNGDFDVVTITETFQFIIVTLSHLVMLFSVKIEIYMVEVFCFVIECFSTARPG